MQGCRKRGKGGKRGAAAKLLCIVSTPPVRWRRPAALIRGWVGGNRKNNRLRSVHRTAGREGVVLPTPPPPHLTSVKPVPKCGSWLMSSAPTMLITRLDCLLKHSQEFRAKIRPRRYSSSVLCVRKHRVPPLCSATLRMEDIPPSGLSPC
jgi:hypothetical protein